MDKPTHQFLTQGREAGIRAFSLLGLGLFFLLGLATIVML
jgi:hypothetical protein